MTLNELRDLAYAYAKKQGFHEQPTNFDGSLMLVVSELSEALEADRNKKWAGYRITRFIRCPNLITKEFYEEKPKGTVEEEIADAIIRLCDLAGAYNIDLEWHIEAKMAFNKTRPYKHGKKY
jgi:NTP pyrophosphatase (non-canonical NTP hydrolase)